MTFLVWECRLNGPSDDFQTDHLLKIKKVENAKSWCIDLVHRAKWRDTMEPTLSVTLTQGNGGWRNFWTNYMYNFLNDKWSVSPIALSVILRCNLSTFPVEWIQFCSDGINFDKLPNCHQQINEMSRLKLEYTIFRHFSGHWTMQAASKIQNIKTALNFVFGEMLMCQFALNYKCIDGEKVFSNPTFLF